MSPRTQNFPFSFHFAAYIFGTDSSLYMLSASLVFKTEWHCFIITFSGYPKNNSFLRFYHFYFLLYPIRRCQKPYFRAHFSLSFSLIYPLFWSFLFLSPSFLISQIKFFSFRVQGNPKIVRRKHWRFEVLEMGICFSWVKWDKKYHHSPPAPYLKWHWRVTRQTYYSYSVRASLGKLPWITYQKLSLLTQAFFDRGLMCTQIWFFT